MKKKHIFFIISALLVCGAVTASVLIYESRLINISNEQEIIACIAENQGKVYGEYKIHAYKCSGDYCAVSYSAPAINGILILEKDNVFKSRYKFSGCNENLSGFSKYKNAVFSKNCEDNVYINAVAGNYNSSVPAYYELSRVIAQSSSYSVQENAKQETVFKSEITDRHFLDLIVEEPNDSNKWSYDITIYDDKGKILK